jgi:hypothetical protein
LIYTFTISTQLHKAQSMWYQQAHITLLNKVKGLSSSSGWHYSAECINLQDIVIIILGICGLPVESTCSLMLYIIELLTNMKINLVIISFWTLDDTQCSEVYERGMPTLYPWFQVGIPKCCLVQHFECWKLIYTFNWVRYWPMWIRHMA